MRFSEFMQSGDYIFPPPVEYGVDFEDLDSPNTHRDQLGFGHRDRLRSEVRIIKARWRLKPEELSALAAHLRPKSFTLRYLDLTEGSYATGNMYCSKKSSKLIVNAASPEDQYIDYSANIIEL